MTPRSAIGSKRLNQNGYVEMKTDNGWQFEHHVVWELANRPLIAGEVIHHKNHVKDDNRLENLEYCESNSAHMKNHHPDRLLAYVASNAEKARGVPRKPEHIAKMCKPKRRPRTPEHAAKIAAALRGRKASPETRAKLSAAHKGKPVARHVIEAMRAAVVGKPKTAEHRAKLSVLAKQQPRDPLTGGYLKQGE